MGRCGGVRGVERLDHQLGERDLDRGAEGRDRAEERELLLAVAHPQREHDLVAFTDDIYEKLAYDGFKPATIVQVEPRLKDRTVTMNGCSKAYAMTGWRLGFAGAPVQLIKAMDKLQSQSTSNTNTIAMAAAVEALTGPQESIEAMRKIFEERRNLVVELLNKAPGIYCHKPEGAFYVYPSIHGCIGKTSKGGVLIKDDETFALTLLAEEGVATRAIAMFLNICVTTVYVSSVAPSGVPSSARQSRFIVPPPAGTSPTPTSTRPA